MVTKNMENAITPKSMTTGSSIGSTKRFRFDSFAMEFACKEKDISPVSTTQSLSSSTHSIHTTDNENMDNDSGIGKFSSIISFIIIAFHFNNYMVSRSKK